MSFLFFIKKGAGWRRAGPIRRVRRKAIGKQPRAVFFRKKNKFGLWRGSPRRNVTSIRQARGAKHHENKPNFILSYKIQKSRLRDFYQRRRPGGISAFPPGPGREKICRMLRRFHREQSFGPAGSRLMIWFDVSSERNLGKALEGRREPAEVS